MADSKNKLLLVKRVSKGGDDENLFQMAAGRRKAHFKEMMHGDSLLEGLGESPAEAAEEQDSPHRLESDSSVTSVNGSGERHMSMSIGEIEDDVFFNQALDASEIEKTCVVAFSTVKHIRDTTGETIKQQLRDYITKIFKLPKSRIEVLEDIASSEECPELRLTCKVLHARSLTAKDANGKSDPYCRLGILSQAHLDSHLVKHKDLVDWKKEGWVTKIGTTSIKLATLDPDWNEEVELTVTDPVNEVLALEIWDSDDDEIQQSQSIKGLKGFGHFLSDLKKGVDDFMGRCFHPLQSIPVSGEMKTLVLRSHSGKTKHGFISLSFDIRGVKENTPLEVSVWEHTMLTRAMVSECTRPGGRYKHRWDGKLPDLAERLLEQHAVLNGLNKLQLTAIRLSVLLKYHKLYAVQVSMLRSLLKKVKEYKSFLPKSLSPEDLQKGGDGKAEEWIVQLFTDLSELAEDIRDMFKRHLSIFNFNQDRDVKKMEDNLIILRELYSFRPFTFQLPSGERNLKEVLESCIQEAAKYWFTVTEAKTLPTVMTTKSELESFKALSDQCLTLGKTVLKKLGPMFMEEGVSYFSQYYVTVEKLLGEKASDLLKKVEPSQEVAPVTFEIHMIIREFTKLSQFLDKNMECDLRLSGCHKWFSPLVKTWITLAIDRCRTRIKKAIELDEIVASEDFKISTSAIDVSGFLMQVGEFWKHLDWPDPSVAFAYMVTILQQMCDLAQFYLREVYQAIGDKFNEQGQFLTSVELSVALNNMQHMRTVVQQLPENMGLQGFYTWLDGQGEEGKVIGNNARDTVGRLLESADDDYGNKIRLIVNDISIKLSGDIEREVEKAVSSPSNISDLDVVAPLLNYLALNLQTIGDNAYSKILDSVLLPIWRVSIAAVLKTLEELKHKKGVDLPISGRRLTAIANLLREFFNADGKGLGDEEMETEPEYKELLIELNLIKTQSNHVILRFFADLARIQAEKASQGEKSYGELLFTTEYNPEKKALNVLVIQGRGLPVMDKAGSTDPYVQLTLLPQWKFGSKKVYKTPVEKSTLDPYFNKEFNIPISEEDMQLEGAILLLSVFDHDIITANDFIGMCVVSLNSIPGVQHRSPTSSPTPTPTETNHTLPLFIITEDLKCRPLAELGHRLGRGDSDVATFFKVNKKILGDLRKLVREGSRQSLFS